MDYSKVLWTKLGNYDLSYTPNAHSKNLSCLSLPVLIIKLSTVMCCTKMSLKRSFSLKVVENVVKIGPLAVKVDKQV